MLLLGGLRRERKVGNFYTLQQTFAAAVLLSCTFKLSSNTAGGWLTEEKKGKIVFSSDFHGFTFFYNMMTGKMRGVSDHN